MNINNSSIFEPRNRRAFFSAYALTCYLYGAGKTLQVVYELGSNYFSPSTTGDINQEIDENVRIAMVTFLAPLGSAALMGVAKVVQSIYTRCTVGADAGAQVLRETPDSMMNVMCPSARELVQVCHESLAQYDADEVEARAQFDELEIPQNQRDANLV